DEQYLIAPGYGCTQMAGRRRRLGYDVRRKRVRRLMRLMGVRALARQPGTSRPAPLHKVDPYLLRDIALERPNQAWCADITYLPMEHGFLYMIAIIDWHSRKVLS